jgi:alpha-glucosidase (family GH31 glycosyl hydrolase)
LISRDGWVLIDDSKRPIFDHSDWPWVQPRPNPEGQDWYFFGYGFHYKRALQDFVEIAGRIPMPPRFAFGIWWSRYWEYTDWELRELAHEFQNHNIPLDVLVVDIDWHIRFLPEWFKNGKLQKDQSGQSYGWTGYTWSKSYFPDPKDFLDWTARQGLKVSTGGLW